MTTQSRSFGLCFRLTKNIQVSNVCNMIQYPDGKPHQNMTKMDNPFSRRTTSGAREWARACFNQLTKTGQEKNGKATSGNPRYRRTCSWHRPIQTCGGPNILQADVSVVTMRTGCPSPTFLQVTSPRP